MREYRNFCVLTSDAVAATEVMTSLHSVHSVPQGSQSGISAVIHEPPSKGPLHDRPQRTPRPVGSRQLADHRDAGRRPPVGHQDGAPGAMLIAIGHTVALEFATIAAANKYWT
jgi:hypothetical protein